MGTKRPPSHEAKKPSKTLKEKRAVKKAKKDSKQRGSLGLPQS
ncbi:MAG: hypothetical protein ACRD0L_17185 [Acidimicrobiales bacterium]